MTKGRKTKGRLAARQASFDNQKDTIHATHRPGSNKKSWPKNAPRGSRNRSHGAKN